MEISGLYKIEQRKDRIRLDVDKSYPQNWISGLWYIDDPNGGPQKLFYWYGQLIWDKSRQEGKAQVKYMFYDKQLYTGKWYTDLFVKYTNLAVKIDFSGGGYATYSEVYKFAHESFQEVYIEFDYQKGYTPVVEINPKSINPENPGELPDKLTIEDVFKKTGYTMYRTKGNNEITLNMPNPNEKVWTNAELHDKMSQHWSHYSNDGHSSPNNPQNIMSIWTFTTTRVSDRGVGGRMFDPGALDASGKPLPGRRGCAIFYESTFYAQDPELNKIMKFMSLIHEIGHCFNLQHSWAKVSKDNTVVNPVLPTPWLPGYVHDEPDSLSFMNYYGNFANPLKNYYQKNRYRFSDQELFFLRHAPKWFRAMNEDPSGIHNSSIDDFDEQDKDIHNHSIQLTAFTNKERNIYNFLEPVVVQFRLKNNSSETCVMEHATLEDDIAVFIKKEGQEYKKYRPFSYSCFSCSHSNLKPGDEQKASLYLSAGASQWHMAEPGNYSITAFIKIGDTIIRSNELKLRVLNPYNKEEDIFAQDYFSNEVARVLYFDGSKFLTKANDILRTCVECFEKHNPETAIHAKIALLMPETYDYHIAASDVNVLSVVPASAVSIHSLNNILDIEKNNIIAQTLGNIDLNDYRAHVLQQLKNITYEVN